MQASLGSARTRAPAAAARGAPASGARLGVSARAYIDSERRSQASPSPSGFKNQLEALRSMSVVVADTGEPALVKTYRPVDCTTNPSLVYKAVQQPEYARFLTDALAARGKGHGDAAHPFAGVADALSVNIGAEMLKLVPGRVSTEVDARLSFDTRATYDKALRLLELYSKKGIEPERVYIKIASTWQGIEACRRLQRQGVDCNMTLLFSFGQAAACADAGAALISPFVGRILDWHKAREGRDYAPHEDPGAHAYPTVVMAASFRNAGEIRELAGCDKITIAPALLAELEACKDPLPRALSPAAAAAACGDARLPAFDGARFGALHGGDPMAVDKLAQGIEGFAADQEKLEAQLAALAAKA
ncbi:transaldolase [Raphidocelis subcapitata]|uniref:Transaldolase n=1 Tax=Raphidocelis subcapitata TaxID=307507 RepID=A0A2V0PL06_9CHLO|nr:transaldolase [Raphidocelis subcapitata]|eukprot:GBG00452.1 transaldolase [Raphidocelis subcapitata]